MEKVRIRELAKELRMETSKEILAFLERIGQKGKSASSSIEGDVIERVKNHFRRTAPPPPPKQTLVVTRADGAPPDEPSAPAPPAGEAAAGAPSVAAAPAPVESVPDVAKAPEAVPAAETPGAEAESRQPAGAG